MITPGFFGLYNSHRALVATQNAMNTVNQNISNANTPGYSRQRVDLAAYTPYADPTIYSVTGGQLGQGVTVTQVTRSRDQFLDTQYRLANGVLGMNTNTRNVLEQLEGIINEPSTGGINASIQDFFDSAQEMSLHPESSAVLAEYVQHASDLLTVFQQQANQLLDLRRNLVGDPSVSGSLGTSQIAIQTNAINNKLQAISNLNKSIVSVQASGAQPNDLLDQRDQLLDDLSNLVDIKVDYFNNGQINVSIAGQTMVQGSDLTNTLEVVVNPNTTATPPTQNDVPALVRTTQNSVVLNDGTGPEITSGALKGIIDMGGNDPNFSSVQSMLEKLNTLVGSIVKEVNTVQQSGLDQNGDPGQAMFTPEDPAFTGLQIFNWQVNPDIQTDPKKIATASGPPFQGVGDGSNALKIAQLRDGSFTDLGGTGFVDYFNGVTAKLGIDSQSYDNATTAQGNLLQSVDSRRQSVSGVNMEEEMIDMLRYQRAFEATSKMISMFDDVYKTIINMAS